MFTTESRNIEWNCIPKSIFSNLFEVYGGVYIPLSNFYKDKLSRCKVAGQFHKGFGAQQCPVDMIENWSNSINKGGTFSHF